MTARLTVGSPAPDHMLVNLAGERVALSSFWANGPVLLTFLRHFG
jgi:peroxiredoxin